MIYTLRGDRGLISKILWMHRGLIDKISSFIPYVEIADWLYTLVRYCQCIGDWLVRYCVSTQQGYRGLRAVVRENRGFCLKFGKCDPTNFETFKVP